MKGIIPITLAAASLVPLSGVAAPTKAQESTAAPGGLTRTVTVTATVLPHREVAVDRNGHIVQVVSNTAQDVAPTFVQDRAGGQALQRCPGCQAAYDQLKGKLDFSFIGQVYPR